MKILIIEQDEASRDLLYNSMASAENHIIFTSCADPKSAEKITDTKYDLVFLGCGPDSHGGPDEKIKRIKEAQPHTKLIFLMSEEMGVAEAVEAIKAGAAECVQKPWDMSKISMYAQVTAGQAAVSQKEKPIKKKNDEQAAGLTGNSNIVTSINSFIKKISDSDLPVLLQGESGTGKDLVAQAIHRSSTRAAKPFIAINCGAFPKDLIENELFGHEKGAFTGALVLKKGLFEAANNGTLFIDEVGELSLANQIKLLRVLESGTFMRLGSTAEVKVSVRIIAATNKVLENEVDAGNFRADLYYRLSVLRIFISPLRDRRDDIPVLVNDFLKNNLVARGKKKILGPGVMEQLMEYNWPGNTRELRNTVDRAVALSEGEIITVQDIPFSLTDKKETRHGKTHSGGLEPFEACMDKAEKEYLEKASKLYPNKSELAKLIKVSRAKLYRKLEKYGLV